MKQVSRSALVPYSAEQVFDVVNDVRSYPEFLPWCDRTEVISESDTELVARLFASRAGISQSLTTHNHMQRPDYIQLGFVDGPFREFSGRWGFTPLGDAGCKVELKLRFEVVSRFTGFALGKVFEQSSDTMVDAFCARLDVVYG